MSTVTSDQELLTKADLVLSLQNLEINLQKELAPMKMELQIHNTCWGWFWGVLLP